MPLYVAASTSQVLIFAAEPEKVSSDGYLRRYFIGRDFQVHEQNLSIRITSVEGDSFAFHREDGKTCTGKVVHSQPPGGVRITCPGWQYEQLVMPTQDSTVRQLLNSLNIEAKRQRDS